MPTEQLTEHRYIHGNHQPENLNLKNIKSNILKLFICKYIINHIMRLKSELYKTEQNEIIDKIISILDLGNKNIYTLYELDNNLEIQTKIMDLIPEIRKWFSFNNMKSVGEPERIKRPWLSIIKHLTKSKYNLESKSFHFKIKEKWIMTQQYIFTKV